MGSWRVRLIVHPATVASLVLLALNDQVLKQRWPGVVTGKLSDFAGVWLIGALAVAVIGRARVGAIGTALAFAALKTMPWVATSAAPLLGGATITDRSDLVALVVLWPLVRSARLLAGATPTSANGPFAVTGAVLVACGAMFATSATSCDTKPDVHEVRLDADGRVLVAYGRYSDEWYVMVDDDPQLDLNAVPVGEVSKRECGRDGCYSVRPTGVYLDHVLVFEYTNEEAREIRRRSGCIQSGVFSSIVVRELPEGDDVWVAMGMAGVLHRSPDGTWNAIRVFDTRPPGPAPVDPPQQRKQIPTNWTVLWIMGAVLAVAITTALVVARRRKRAPVTTGGGLPSALWYPGSGSPPPYPVAPPAQARPPSQSPPMSDAEALTIKPKSPE